jgi:hypothetical protein
MTQDINIMQSDEQHEIVTPDASPVIQSLRAIGYSLETAVADIIDNSLDAKATQISIDMHWGEERSYIRIEDNGRGMTEQELTNAMRLGSKNPLDKRGAKELGRFGMGLKTASFSLGQRLTVLSKKENKVHIRCWDLEVVQEKNEWQLLKSAYSESLPLLGSIEVFSGTIVLIEKLDRIVQSPFTANKQKKFYRQIHFLEKHLQMVFHRFLEGNGRIRVTLNGNVLLPWDPFCTKLQYTHEMGSENQLIDGKLINIEGFILPHHSKMTKAQYNEAGGPNGWYDQQGFYIYRNKRLLTISSWLSLFPKEEASKLARIRVDIGQDSDFDWQIDVKKSVARPPQETIDILKRWAERARDLSQKVYYHRGVPKKDAGSSSKDPTEFDLLWSQSTRNQRSYFMIHKDNPLLIKIRGTVDKEVLELLDSYLNLVQEFCPINTLVYAPLTEHTPLLTIAESDKHNMINIVKFYRQMNIPDNDIVNSLKSMPSFAKYTEELLEANIREELV